MFFPIVLVFCFISLGQCEEPKSCSQFDYLNQLLLKMVRFEVRGESLEKEIATTNSNVQLTLGELKNEDTVIKSIIKELKDFQIKTDNVIESQANEIKKLNELLKTLTTKPTEMKENMVTPNIMFKARTVKDKRPSKGDTIIFQDIMFNYGDGYDETTGIFTAPITGNYLFTIHMCMNSEQSFYYGILKEGSIHTAGEFFDRTAFLCYTADAMMRLDAGQKVWLKCLSGSSSNDILMESTSSTSNYWNTFSGMLVHV